MNKYLEAALTIAERDGLRNLTHQAIAKEIGGTKSTVVYQMGGMDRVVESVVEAVMQDHKRYPRTYTTSVADALHAAGKAIELRRLAQHAKEQG